MSKLSPRHFVPAALLGMLLCACGREPVAVPGGAVSLLVRAPDLVVEQPGEVVPEWDGQWGRLGLAGWREYTEEGPGGQPCVWAHTPVASLEIPATTPIDRKLEFSAWAAVDAGSAQPLRVRLNGFEMGRFELSEQPREFEVETPGAAWRRGSNVLEFEVDGLLTSSDGSKNGFALARVAWGPRRRASVAPDGIVLEPDTGVRYFVEPLTELELELGGQASGGHVEVVLRFLDPATGEVDDQGFDPVRIDPRDGLLDTRLPLPDAGGRVLELGLDWITESDEEARLDRIFLHEARVVERTPIIFISIDTLAAKHLQLHGYARETAPQLGKFADEAVLFERCQANAPWTLPSYMSVMSGLYPNSHRLEFDHWSAGSRPLLWETWWLAENRWTMAEMLRSAGYRTAGFVDNLWITERFRFPQGFDTYDASAGDIVHEEPDGGIRHVTKLAKSWIDSLEGEESFFLFMHCFDVHGPFLPIDPYRGRFDGDKLYDELGEAPAGGPTNAFGVVPTYVARGEIPEGELPEEIELGPIATAYDEGILKVDHELGLFFDWLRERGLYDRSMIIISADHGESMNGHDYYFGHGVLYEDVVHVPLMVRMPGGANGGRRIASSVQLVDLYPSIQEWIGLPQRDFLHGRSFVDVLRGADAPVRPVYSESGIMDQAAVVVGDWKLIEMNPHIESGKALRLTFPYLSDEWKAANVPELASGALTDELMADIETRPEWRKLNRELRDELARSYYELYHLPSDPHEKTNLYEREPERAAQLLEALERERAKRERARDAAKTPSTPPSISGDDQETLEALGYTGNG